MIPTWIALVCLLALLWARNREQVLVVALVGSAFGASAALEVSALGSAPVSPVLLSIPFLALAAVKVGGLPSVASQLSLRRPGGWLAIYCVWAVVSAYFLPRYFEGETVVYTTSRTVSEAGVLRVPLAPNSTNLTQSVYLLSGLIAFLAVAALTASPAGLAWARRGIVAAGIANVSMAALHIASGYGGVELGLSVIRNANYAIVDQRFAGMLRVQGAFPEPSAFAAYTATLVFAFGVLWTLSYRPRLSGSLCIGNLAALMLSLSTTAYAAVGVVVVVLVLWTVLLRVVRPGGFRFNGWTILLLGLVAAGCLIVIASPKWLNTLFIIVDNMLVRKLDSDSGVERTDWMLATWSNFVDTYGLGAGAGSSRGSSFPLILLGNVGVIGTAAFVAFSILLLRGQARHLEPDRLAMCRAARLGTFTALVAASISATMIDLGPTFYILAGIAAGTAGVPAGTRRDSLRVADWPSARAAG